MPKERTKLKCATTPVSAFFKSIILAISLFILLVKFVLKFALGWDFIDFSTDIKTIGTLLLLFSLAGLGYKFAKLYYDYKWFSINCGE